MLLNGDKLKICQNTTNNKHFMDDKDESYVFFICNRQIFVILYIKYVSCAQFIFWVLLRNVMSTLFKEPTHKRL